MHSVKTVWKHFKKHNKYQALMEKWENEENRLRAH